MTLILTVQRRDVQAMGGDDSKMHLLWSDEECRIKADAAKENALLKRVQR